LQRIGKQTPAERTTAAAETTAEQQAELQDVRSQLADLLRSAEIVAVARPRPRGVPKNSH